MRNNRPSRRSRSNPFSRLFNKATPAARKAPRRRDVERLEERQMLTATPQTNEFFADQWNLVANGQITEFDPTSPTQEQTRAVPGEDINILPAWATGLTGSGIQIAVIDGGFDLTHEDLALAYVNGETLTTNLDLLFGDTDPSFVDTSDFTGTAYASLIAAADNDLGIVGIAHGAQLFPVRLNPGAGDGGAPSIDAINSAFRFQAGFVQDGDGDGVPDSTLGGALVPIDIDGDGTPDGLGQDPSLVTDVFFHSGSFQDLDGFNRGGVRLPSAVSGITGQTISVRDAIQDTAINGRAVWIDRNNDGLLGTDEIEALGSIHIVPAGNDGGSFSTTPPFGVEGALASSQYDELANSIYTIAVGAVDPDGTSENPATGTLSNYSEGGANVLLVAPSGNLSQDITTSTGLNSGLVTADLTGEGGRNQSPVFNFEFDNDFFSDIDYTSRVSGTEAAAAQVAAVVGLMLEANPLLSARDVQQILLMSARQNDEFSESWITNSIQDFEDPNVPQYVTTSLGGTADVEAAIVPNSQYDPIGQDFLTELGFYTNENAIADLGVPFVFAPADRIATDPDTGEPIFFTDASGEPQLDENGFPIPRFFETDPTGNQVLLGKAILNADGVAVLTMDDDPAGFPIIELGARTFTIDDPGGGDPVNLEIPFIGLLYGPNGNLIRPNIPDLDDMAAPPTPPTFSPVPSTLNVNNLVLADPGVTASGFGGFNPVTVFATGTIAENQRGGLGPLVNPLRDRSELNPLQFENGAGFTVSAGYGSSLEEINYGHGVLDAGLAVELALAWGANDLSLDDAVTVTSGVLGGTTPTTLQAGINIALEGVTVLTVPGGIIEPGGDPLNAAFYNEFFADIDATDVPGGEVITAAPFFNLDEPLNSDRGATEIPFEFDVSLQENFVSLEWIEVTGSILSGDPDNLRLSIRSPDGTQTELNPFRAGAGSDLAPQDPQGQQGSLTASEQPIKLSEGGINIGANGRVIDDSRIQQIIGVDNEGAEFLPAAANTDPDDPAGQAWTWTTNRHWGEIFSTPGNSSDVVGPNLGTAGYLPSEGWSLIIENHDIGAQITLGGQLEIAVHGTKATGNRIQGKVGVDDNKQGIQGTANDQNFNFNRYIEFGVLDVDYTNDVGKTFAPDQFPIVLDDTTDSVTYNNSNGIGPNGFSLDNIYKSVNPDTGVEVFYPVVNKADYLALRDSDEAAIAVVEAVQDYLRAIENDPSIAITRAELATSYDRFTDPRDDATINEAVANGFYGALPNDFRADPLVFRNFDYSQEGFAGGVAVQATQLSTQFDLAASIANGEPTPVGSGPTATGVVDTFVTGADGNYYFDVEAVPAPPTLLDCLVLIPGFDPAAGPTPEQLASAQLHFETAFTEWFNTFGGATFTYDISIVSDDASRIITNGGAGYFNSVQPGSLGSTITFDGTSSYAVDIFADDFIAFGETAKITNVNFLLEVDPALTNATVEGTVFRDRNGNGLQDAGIDDGIAGVTVFQDANVNGVLDAGEISTTTEADGTYSFVITGLLSTADIQVAIENTPSDLVTANPASGFQTITAIPGATVGADFTLRLATGEPAIVLGSVFEDVNANGVRDTGESPFSDTVLVGGVETPVIAYVDLDGNGSRDDTDPSATVRTDGTFLIETTSTGSAELLIELPSDTLTQTLPGSSAGVAVTLVAGQQVELIDAFGVLDGRVFDYGDLFVDPSIGANFPTLLADDGARHVVIDGIRLGSRNDVDDDGFQNPTRDPSLDGLGDDFSNLDDEDGIVIASGEFSPGSTLQFDIEAYGQGAVLNAWIDFNGNGQWESHEQVFTDLSDIAFGPNGEAPTAAVPAITVPGVRQAGDADDGVFFDTSADFFAARFRWGPFGLTPSGPANAGEVEDYLFAATPPIVITGAVRDDTADGDGVFEPSDVGVEGVRVFYDIDVDGVVDFDEPRAVTDANGEYRLEINTNTNLDITVRIDTSTLPIGLETLSPPDGIFNQNIAVSEQVESNYLVGAPQGLTGNVFSDADNDGARDAGENGFAGITVEVFQDTDSDGTFETSINSTTTDANGDYIVPIASVGQYEVRLDLSAPEAQFLTQTLPAASAAQVVTAVAGTFTTVPDFGVFDAVPTFILDYGDLIVDATRNFPTTLGQNGARHLITPGVFLGAGLPDADPGTLQSVNATADDLLFSPDDEDGVQLRSNIAADSIVLIDVTATGSSDNRLHAWIDFNNDGDWDDAGEQITSPGGNTLPSGQTSQLVIDTTGIEVDATATAYAARFRWGQGITGFDGPATTGEVEDYLLPRVISTTPTDTLSSDFNGDGVVDLLDLDVLGSNFGAGPGATKAQGDANADGDVNLLDLDILGSEFGSVATSSSLALATASDEGNSPAPPIALATAPIDPEGVPPLVLHSPAEGALEPVVLDANAFVPLLVPSAAVESAVDESLAVDANAPEASDAIDAALLEWSLGGVPSEEGEEVEVFSTTDGESEAAEEAEELLAQVFAF